MYNSNLKKIGGILFVLMIISLGTYYLLDTPHQNSRPLLKGDRILVEKSSNGMTLFTNDKPIRTYKVRTGRPGPKVYEGDRCTPEGNYLIDSRLKNSDFYLALHISYPNKEDRERAKRQGKSPWPN